MTDRGRFALSTIDGRSLSLPSHILLDVLGRTLRRPGRASCVLVAAIAPSAARSSGAVTFRVAARLSPQAARRAAGIPCEPPRSAGQGRPRDPRGRRPWRSSDRRPSAQAAPPSPGSNLSHEGHRQERREVISAHAIQRDHGTRARSRHEDEGVLTAPSEKVSAQYGTRRYRLDTAGLFHWRPGLKVPNRGHHGRQLRPSAELVAPPRRRLPRPRR